MLKPRNLVYILITILLIGVYVFNSGKPKVYYMSGFTMGTLYHISIVTDDSKLNIAELQKEVETKLKQLNQIYSRFDEYSQISEFNKLQVGEHLRVSDKLYELLKISKEVYQITKGAWDPTVTPVMKAWGFDQGKPRYPSKKELGTLKKDIGFSSLILEEDGFIKKSEVNIQIDLSSVAKGYAVDDLASFFKEKGFSNFLIEIGGEIFASGRRSPKMRWSIGISQPNPDADNQDIVMLIDIEDSSVATSGDYRKFFEKDGRRYSHIINPRTLSPVNNGVASVTIVAKTCVWADALATSVMVLGEQEGLKLIESIDNTECLIIVREGDAYKKIFSKAFSQFVSQP